MHSSLKGDGIADDETAQALVRSVQFTGAVRTPTESD